MKQEILFIILNEYADWEGAFIAACLNAGVMPGSEVKYTPKVVAPTLDAVRSIGGFRTLPDYCFQTMPTDYAALVLIGGMQWNSPEAEQAVPLVKDALQRGKIVGAICNAASFMAKHGFLNNVKHTGNTIQQLKLWGSININVLDESFETMADSTLQKDKPVAVYCRSGKRSKKAAAILSKKGYIIYDLDKGFIGWEEAGKEVEK